MAKQRRTPGEVAFLASICPASQPNRAPLGRHARLGHTQSALCNVQPVHQGDFRFLPHDPTRKMARIPRHRHRQLPHRIVQGIQENLSPKLQVNSGRAVYYNFLFGTSISIPHGNDSHSVGVVLIAKHGLFPNRAACNRPRNIVETRDWRVEFQLCAPIVGLNR